jgi:hypothetical protein
MFTFARVRPRVVGTPACNDCNENGILDECDIAHGTSLYDDGDGIPDECGPAPASANLVKIIPITSHITAVQTQLAHLRTTSIAGYGPVTMMVCAPRSSRKGFPRTVCTSCMPT